MSKSSRNLESKRRRRFSGAMGNPNFFNYLDFDWDWYHLLRPNVYVAGKMSTTKARCKRRRKVVFSDYR